MKVWLWLGLSKVFIGCYFFFFSHLEVDFQVFPNFVTLQYLSAFEFPGYELIAAHSPGIKYIHGFIGYGNFQVLQTESKHHTIISVHATILRSCELKWVKYPFQSSVCFLPWNSPVDAIWLIFSHLSLRLILTEARWCLQFFCSWLYFGLLDPSLMCSWSNFPFLWRFTAVPPEAFSPLWIMAPTVVWWVPKP